LGVLTEDDLSPFDEVMLATIGRITNPRTGLYKRVYAHNVAVYLPVERAIRSLRRDMARLAEAGYLERLGERRGYRLAHPHSIGSFIGPGSGVAASNKGQD
jgi:hypothetical protein